MKRCPAPADEPLFYVSCVYPDGRKWRSCKAQSWDAAHELSVLLSLENRDALFFVKRWPCDVNPHSEAMQRLGRRARLWCAWVLLWLAVIGLGLWHGWAQLWMGVPVFVGMCGVAAAESERRRLGAEGER